jgi:hypothetical protein
MAQLHLHVQTCCARLVPVWRCRQIKCLQGKAPGQVRVQAWQQVSCDACMWVLKQEAVTPLPQATQAPLDLRFHRLMMLQRTSVPLVHWRRPIPRSPELAPAATGLARALSSLTGGCQTSWPASSQTTTQAHVFSMPTWNLTDLKWAPTSTAQPMLAATRVERCPMLTAGAVTTHL